MQYRHVFHDKLHDRGLYLTRSICNNVAYSAIKCIFLDGGLYLTKVNMQ